MFLSLHLPMTRRFGGPFAQASKSVRFVEVKTIKQISLMRVIAFLRTRFGWLQASTEVVEALKSLVDHDLLSQEVNGQEVHGHVRLLHQPIVDVPLRVDSEHGVGELVHFQG